MAVAVQAEKKQDTSKQDASSFLQQESRRFATLYERHAYVAYNLALRITCEPARAMAAAERAFLLQLGQDPSEARLILGVVNTAREEASEKPKPGGAGDADAARLLASMATLPMPDRIVLGLMSVDHGATAMIAAGTTLPEAKAEEIREDAQSRMAAALKVDRPEAQALASDWPWAQPPPELWQSTYAKAYRALETGVARPGANGAAPAVIVSRDDRQPPPVPLAGRRRSWLMRGALVAGVLLPAAIAGAVVFGGGDSTSASSLGLGAPTDGSAPAVAGEDGESSGESSYQSLTPQELDKLRLNELRALRKYSQEQQNKGLSLNKRRRAADRAALLAERARNRLRAERAARERRAAAKRRADARRRADTSPRRRPSPSSPPPSQPRDTTPSQPAPRKDTSSKEDCLYDENKGSYICPT